MEVEPRYTRHQVQRASRPDAVTGRRCYLIKNVPLLRLTYQVRLLADIAEQRLMLLVLVLPPRAELSDDLRRFVAARRSVSILRGSGATGSPP